MIFFHVLTVHYFYFKNRYLEGDQIQGQASTKAYVNALKMGCRCVECKTLNIILEQCWLAKVWLVNGLINLVI